MYTRRWYLGLLLSLGVLGAQAPPASIQVAGAVKQPLTLTADDLATMPRATVKTIGNGTETIYQGVWLHEVLKRAGVPQGGALRGKALAGYVLAEAQDGYQVVFSLGELDPAFIDNEILLGQWQGPLRSTGPFPPGSAQRQARSAFSSDVDKVGGRAIEEEVNSGQRTASLSSSRA